MRNFISYFIYISLLFLVASLINGDYLRLPSINSPKHLILCLLFLFFGFLADAFSWWKTMVGSEFKNVSFKSALASQGFSVFGKYIPGKLWIVLGRSAFIAKEYQANEKDLAILSLTAQFISLWTGFILGAFNFLFVPIKKYIAISIFCLVLWSFLTLILFTGIFHRKVREIAELLFKKKLSVPCLKFATTLKILPYYFSTWLCWCLSFHFLVLSIVDGNQVPCYTGFSFAFAATTGLIVLVAPGGIGVREGILTGLLHLWGLSLNDSVTVAVASRLWFLVGEFFIFMLGIVFSNRFKLPGKENAAQKPR